MLARLLDRVRALSADTADDARALVSGERGARLGRRLARSPLSAIALAVLCAAVYLPGIAAIPAVDRDESRFAQASRQMFEAIALPADQQRDNWHDGGLAIPKIQDRPRLNKPPLVYWLHTATASILTTGRPLLDAIWMYRLPSAIAATIAVLLTWRLGLAMFDPRVGLLAAALLAVCPMVVWDAHQARADQLLLASTTLAQLGLWRAWRESRQRANQHARPCASLTTTAILWGGIALGILAKGPLTPMIAALTAAAICAFARDARWLRTTRPILGLTIIVLALAPWLFAVAGSVGLSNYLNIVRNETITRSATAKEGHWGPPGYHLVLLPVLFWPGSLVTGLAIAHAFRRALRARSEQVDTPDTTPSRIATLKRKLAAIRHLRIARRSEAFCLAWIIPSWIVFELVSTKLPHYTLPLYPAIALLTARGLLAIAAGTDLGAARPGARLGFAIWVGIGIAITVAMPLGLAILGAHALAFAAAVVLALSGVWLIWRARRQISIGQLAIAQLTALAAAVIAMINITGVVLPNARALWITDRLAAIIHEQPEPATGPRPIAALGYHEDSLIFATRGRATRIDDADAWARRNPGGILIAPAGTAAGLVADSAINAELLGSVKGLNYSRGRFETIEVIRLD